jgi:hypothetical protein
MELLLMTSPILINYAIMIDHKLGIEWRCTARYDNVDEEMLNL